MSIDDNFTDDTILVTLSQKASINFKRYKTSDFPEVNLVSVIEITEDLTNRAEKQAQNNNTNGNDNNSNNGQDNNGNGRRINIDSFKRIFQLKLAEPSKESVLEAISVLGKRDDVRAAEPNYIGEFLVAPNDTYISSQWAINNMRLPEAWELSTGANTVRVGLVDSGIDRNHPDLAGRINEGLSRDHSGGGNPWTGTNGHGTHTAGIIGAIGNNSRGVVGTNWDVELVSLKVGDGGPTAAAVAAAITHATNNDIRILSMSLSINETTAINDAIALFDGVIIAAAGNSGSSSVGYPARLNNPKIVSVGSIDSDNARSSFSCWGKVDIWAPGGGILSTWPTALSGSDSGKPGYRTESGTSMATPYVAGVAALMLAVNPNLTFQQLTSNIINSGSWIDIKHPSGFLNLGSTIITVRRLDAYEAVKAIATFDTRVLSDTTIEIRGTFGRQLSGSVTIPEILNGRSVTTIAASAFANQTQISQIIIPASVTSIGSNAFKNCWGLTNLTLPDNLTSIGSSAFEKCKNLTSITIPNTVTSIGSNTFYGCTSLTSITLPSNITSLSSGVLSGCSSLTSITIPNTVTSIGSDAFNGCTSLTSITIPSSVTSLDSSVLSGCSSLTSITIPFIGQSRTATGNSAKFGYIFGTSSYYRGIATDQNGITYYIPIYLETVIITGGTNISQNAFYNCSCLKSITIPNTVTSIGSNAFYNSHSLADITIPNTVTSIGTNAFNGCISLTSLTIPNSVTSLGSSVLSSCANLKSITIPFVGKSRTATGNDAKFGYIFGTSPFQLGNSRSTDQNGIIYYLPVNLKTVVITDGTNIPQDAFYNCTYLTTITIPNSVTSIGSNAFYNCTYLANFTIPNSVTSIGSNAFNGCACLRSLTIPNSVTSLGNSVLSGCYNLKSITIPFVGKSRTATGNDAKFGYLFGTSSYSGGVATNQNGITYYIPTNLETVVITSGTSIPQDAFYNCSRLTNITIPSSVTSLGSNVFYGCTNLSSLMYHVVVTTSGYYYIQIENISSVTVKIDGVITPFSYDYQPKYLTAGNHTIQAESANIATKVSFPIIALTDCVPYSIDIDNIYKEFYDGPEMQYVTYPVTTFFSQPYNFDPINRSVTFTSITCEWELENMNYQNIHLIQMFIGENYYYENGGLYFECYDGYQSSPNTWSYSATLYNITIIFSQYEWDQYVHLL